MKNRVKVDIVELTKKEHYSNIIKLLQFFQDKDIDREDGLEQKHFRYALIDNESEQLYYTPGVERFFKNGILLLWQRVGLIRKGSVATQRNLNYYLKYLLQNNVIEKVNRKKPFRYKLTSEYQFEQIKVEMRLGIESMDSDSTFHKKEFFENYVPSDTKMDKHDSPDYITNEHWSISGLPLNLYKLFSENEIKQIATYLKNVEDNLWKISEIKYAKVKSILLGIWRQKNSDIPQVDPIAIWVGRAPLIFYYSAYH